MAKKRNLLGDGKMKTLSDKRFKLNFQENKWKYMESDVREAIKKLRERLVNEGDYYTLADEIIKEEFGEDLT